MTSVAPSMRREAVSVVRDPVPHPRVFVVDDEDLVRDFVRRALEKAGYIVNCASSGRHALRAIEGGDRYDLIVADVNMPAMSGPQFVARMRRAGVHMKVLYLTGFAERLLEEHSSLWLDDAFLEKPCTAQALVDSVSILLRGQVHGLRDASARQLVGHAVSRK